MSNDKSNYMKQKRIFDFCAAFLALVIFWPVILFAWIMASFDTRSNGFFLQERVGYLGKRFLIVKIKTMRPVDGVVTTVTTRNDPRITKTGTILRQFKLDELPQLWNVLIGQMSFVGPRPDIPSAYREYSSEIDTILSVRPGITGPATLYFRAEEELLTAQPDPESYNDEVIWPTKVRLNTEYVDNLSFRRDLKYIVRTIFPE